jgi:hypothetical protein
MKIAREEKPPFPWSFLSEPDGAGGDLAAIWIFMQLQSKAYKGFLESGPGLLVGPYLTDENDISITSQEALRRRANDETVGISVMYLPVNSADFREFALDDTLRQTIWCALDRYDPETQCVVLPRHDDTLLFVRIVGVAGEPSNRHTPRVAYYREILDKTAAVGLPN